MLNRKDDYILLIKKMRKEQDSVVALGELLRVK
jgi:hypothetical protein